VGEVSTINLKTAKTLGLAVSLHLQQLTDEVITADIGRPHQRLTGCRVVPIPAD
jgi:hypothetical protein